jgi:uncharacterized phage protein (TIGR01671 family)
MREIKFRAINTNTKKFVIGNFHYGWDLKPCIQHSISDTKFINTIIDINTLGQFTGLHDKNGKEIYEGDILKVGEFLVCEIIYIGKNVDDYGDELNCAFHAKVCKNDKIIPLDAYLKLNCFLIGNIHENSNLINQ